MFGRIGVALVVLVASVTVPAATATASANPWPHTIGSGFSTASGNGYWLVYKDGTVSTTGDAHFYGNSSREPHQSHCGGSGRAGRLAAIGSWQPTAASSASGVRAFPGRHGRHTAQSTGVLDGGHRDRTRLLARRSRRRDFQFRRHEVLRIDGRNTSSTSRSRGSHAARRAAAIGWSPRRRHLQLRGRPLLRQSGLQRGVHASDAVGMAASPTNKGYWIARSDGSVYTFGDALRYPDYRATPANPIQAIFGNPSTRGYRLVAMNGSTFSFGSSSVGTPPPTTTTTGRFLPLRQPCRTVSKP